jgi:hypothetical protein
LGTWNAPEGHSREWRHKRRHYRHRSSSSPFLRYTALALAGVLAITLVWRGIHWTMHSAHTASVPAASWQYVPTSPTASADAVAALWQREYDEALDIAAQDVSGGQISQAEVAVDRAETVITAQRLQSGNARPEFFAPAVAALDRVLAKRPDDTRLSEHVTLARISLAEFRSSLASDPPQPADVKRISIGVPRELTAGSTLDPASFGARILDASLMPGTAEMLLPPSSRAFADGILVENLTLQGAAQTLDGIRWRDVTFVATRVRYEGRELDLQNVHFVRCRFGFTTGDPSARSVRLANAIALGQSSITVQ